MENVIIQELELKKPWMTDEIRNEIQRKNKLYAKAKKNKDAVEWEEFKDLRNKVTRMIRDAKNEYLAKHPEQVSFFGCVMSKIFPYFLDFIFLLLKFYSF